MTNILKPFDDRGYISPEAALKSLKKERKVRPQKMPKQALDYKEELTVLDPECERYINGGGRKAIRDADSWMNYFNQKGLVMASMADFYKAGKMLMRGGPYADDRFKDVIRLNDINEPVITSTRVEYSGFGVNAELTHHHGSSVLSPYTRTARPSFKSHLLEDMLNENYGVDFMRAIMDTSDPAEEIKQVVMTIMGYGLGQIFVLTPYNSATKTNDSAPSAVILKPVSLKDGSGCRQPALYISCNRGLIENGYAHKMIPKTDILRRKK